MPVPVPAKQTRPKDSRKSWKWILPSLYRVTYLGQGIRQGMVTCRAMALQNPSGYICEINRSRLFFFFSPLKISIQTLYTCSHLASLRHFKAIKLVSHIPIMASTGFVLWYYSRRHGTSRVFLAKAREKGCYDRCWMLTNVKLFFATRCCSATCTCLASSNLGKRKKKV